MPVLERLKAAYILWYGYYQILPKTHRYTIGRRIDLLYVETIETVAAAGFIPRDEKMPYVRLAIRKIDAVQVFLQILWELKSLDTKTYVALAAPATEIGKMLGGWYGQLAKQNSPARTGEK